MFNWAYSKFSRPTIFAYRVKNWIQQFQLHHFQLLKPAHEQHYFALFPRRSVFVCMFCLFICFLAHITHWAISMKEKVFSKQKQKLDFEIRTVKVLIKIHPISSSAACSSKCKTFDSSNCGNNCWCLKKIIIQFLSIPQQKNLHSLVSMYANSRFLNWSVPSGYFYDENDKNIG